MSELLEKLIELDMKYGTEPEYHQRAISLCMDKFMEVSLNCADISGEIFYPELEREIAALKR